MDEKIEKYILDIVFATRSPKDYNLSKYASMITATAVRPVQALEALHWHVNRMHFIKRRGYVIPEDVRAICHDVLRHRIGFALLTKPKLKILLLKT